MARSNIKAVFENDVQTVWNVITDVKNYIYILMIIGAEMKIQKL